MTKIYSRKSIQFNIKKSNEDIHEGKYDQLFDNLLLNAQQQGSNAWVISGKYSDNGKPIVANDPHMGLTQPALIYPCELDINGRSIMGATIGGVPVVVMGKNKDFAWGLTSLYIDSTDVYRVILDENRTHYWYEGKWRELQVREETINIRFKDPLVLQFYSTHHGPIVDTIFNDLHLKYGFIMDNLKNESYALSASQLVEKDLSLEGNLEGLKFRAV